MDRKITHEIKIPKSIVVVLYAILFVLTLNLVSPFFQVLISFYTGSAIEQAELERDIGHMRCPPIKWSPRYISLEKAERARRTAEAVASNRLAGSTSLASAAREMATAAAGKAVTGWQYDATSGLYYDVSSQTWQVRKFDERESGWSSTQEIFERQRTRHSRVCCQ